MHANFLAKDVVLLTLFANFGLGPSLSSDTSQHLFELSTDVEIHHDAVERNRTQSQKASSQKTSELVASTLPKYRSIAPILAQIPIATISVAEPFGSTTKYIPQRPNGDYFMVDNNRIVFSEDNQEDWLESLSTNFLANHSSLPGSTTDISAEVEHSMAIDVADIPKRFAQFAGQAITLFQANGHSCHGWIDGFRLEQRKLMNNSLNWVQRENESLFGPPSDLFSNSSSDEYRQDWRSRSTLRLTATIITADEICQQPRWARLAKLPTPQVLMPTPLTTKNGSMFQAVWSQLQSDTRFLDRQEPYIELQNDEKQWKQYVRKRLKLQAWLDHSGGIRFISAVLLFPEDQCHNWGAPRTLVWEISHGTFTRFFASFAASPVSIMDVDADGNMDVLSANFRNGAYSLSYGSLDGLIVEDELEVLDVLDSDPC